MYFLLLVLATFPAPVEEKLSTVVRLSTRTEQRYGDSAYSFRYRANSRAKHKNYVDLVYESGMMRVNHHAGVKNQITDLGPDVEVTKSYVVPEDAEWAEDMLVPAKGHYYAMKITAFDGKEMKVIFKVDDVTRERLTIRWNANSVPKWPALGPGVGDAGESGMIQLEDRSNSPYKR